MEKAKPAARRSASIDAATLAAWLADGDEIALLDLREEGQHGAGHPLLSVNLPYSRLEQRVSRLVPRRSCRIVLVDDGDGVADRGLARLEALGYRAAHVLSGGVGAWQEAGHQLFESTNVPSKAFAEIVEHELGTPAISAAELDARRRAGEDIVVLDSRTVEEFGLFHVPGAVSCPGAELVHRFADLVPSPDSVVVVSCAGRTRGIIGAQALIDAGVPNPVAALSGGTQGWRLAGLELERGVAAAPHRASPAALEAARERAAAVSRGFGVRHIDHATLARWRAEADRRTLYLLDVRMPAEFAVGHLPGSVSAQGGQLVQAIDRWVGVRGARLVLVDEGGARAVMTAHWLQQMGWDVHVLDRALDGVALETGADEEPSEAGLPGAARLDADAAKVWLDQGAALVSVQASAGFRKAHPAGAVWSIRPRLDRLPERVRSAPRIILLGDDEAVAALAAADLAEISPAQIAVWRGGIAAWNEAGLPVEASPETPPDAERIDTLFWNHDRHDGNAEAMRAYLRWETELPARIAAEGNAGFRTAPARARQ